jgi:hypothetical protein
MARRLSMSAYDRRRPVAWFRKNVLETAPPQVSSPSMLKAWFPSNSSKCGQARCDALSPVSIQPRLFPMWPLSK